MLEYKNHLYTVGSKSSIFYLLSGISCLEQKHLACRTCDYL